MDLAKYKEASNFHAPTPLLDAEAKMLGSTRESVAQRVVMEYEMWRSHGVIRSESFRKLAEKVQPTG